MIIYYFILDLYVNNMREFKNKRKNTCSFKTTENNSSQKQYAGNKRQRSQTPITSIVSSKNLNANSNKRKKVDLDSDNCNEIEINDITTKLNKEQINSNGDAIIYTRVSSKNQSFGTSLDSQLELCKEYCVENNFKIISEISEVVSARNIEKQENLLKIFSENKDFNLIILEPTRISRDLCGFINQYNYYKDNNITLHFVQDNLISNNSIDFKKIISGVYDGENESIALSNRIKHSIKKRKSNGTYFPSTTPYGFDYQTCQEGNKTVKVLVENTKEQEIIDLINKLHWGANFKELEAILQKITGEKHDLYFPNFDNDTTNCLKYGNLMLVDIANFLNSIHIQRRNHDWNPKSVKQLVDY